MIFEDVLYTAFRIAGILGDAGRTMSMSEMADGLRIANSMFDSFQADRLLVYAIDRQEYALTPSKPSYTIGIGGDISIARPVKIERAGLVMLTANPPMETSLAVLETEQQWADVSPKGMQSTFPSKVYYQPKVPYGVLWVWPIPTVANKLALYPWVTLAKVGQTTDVIEFPQGYQELVEYNLAVRLAAQFPGRANISPASIMIAKEAIARVKGINEPAYLMRTELGAMGYSQANRGHRWNILTNDWSR